MNPARQEAVHTVIKMAETSGERLDIDSLLTYADMVAVFLETAPAHPWVEPLIAFLTGQTETLNFLGQQIPPRLEALLHAYFSQD